MATTRTRVVSTAWRAHLLAEEIELRRHIERVATQRRALPPGGEVPTEYRFESDHGPVRFRELFGDKDTLIIYSFMYGPDRAEGCPMCTSQMSFGTATPRISSSVWRSQ